MFFTLVGAHFRPQECRNQVKALEIGDKVELRADPDNQYDDTAVAVYSNNLHIGFVPRELNAELFERLIVNEEILAEVLSFESSIKPVLSVE